jgi:hypothetical protein
MVGFVLQKEWSFEVFLFLPDNLGAWRLMIRATVAFIFLSPAAFSFSFVFFVFMAIGCSPDSYR